MEFSPHSIETDPETVDEKSPLTESESHQIYGGVASPSALLSPPPDIALRRPPSRQKDPTPWSSPVQTLLDQPPATLPTRLLIGGLAFCVAFGAWAWFGKIEDIGKATGKLVPKGETYKIQPLEPGKASRIEVKEGDHVKKGQVIAELDTSLAQKEVERLQQTLMANQLELVQKQGLLEQLTLQARTQQAIASAEEKAQVSAIALALAKLETTKQLLKAQESEATAYRGRYRQLQPMSQQTATRLAQLQAEREANQERVNRLKPLVLDGAISQEMLYQAEQALRDTEQKITVSQLQDVNNTNEQIFQASQSLRDLDSRITQNQGELAKTYQEIAQLQAQLNQKRAQAEAAQLETNQQKEELKLSISGIVAKIADSKTLLASAQTKLKDKYLKSPVNGTILALNIKNSGEVVQAGQTVAEIAPDGVPLVLSAKLPNREAGSIKAGLTVQVKLDAFPYQDYGVISGQVSQVSADAKSDKDLGEIYQVEITLDRDSLSKNQRTIQFKPGQTATAEIIIRRRRIADVLLEPIKKLQQDGLKL